MFGFRRHHELTPKQRAAIFAKGRNGAGAQLSRLGGRDLRSLRRGLVADLKELEQKIGHFQASPMLQERSPFLKTRRGMKRLGNSVDKARYNLGTAVTRKLDALQKVDAKLLEDDKRRAALVGMGLAGAAGAAGLALLVRSPGARKVALRGVATVVRKSDKPLAAVQELVEIQRSAAKETLAQGAKNVEHMLHQKSDALVRRGFDKLLGESLERGVDPAKAASSELLGEGNLKPGLLDRVDYRVKRFVYDTFGAPPPPDEVARRGRFYRMVQFPIARRTNVPLQEPANPGRPSFDSEALRTRRAGTFAESLEDAVGGRVQYGRGMAERHGMGNAPGGPMGDEIRTPLAKNVSLKRRRGGSYGMGVQAEAEKLSTPYATGKRWEYRPRAPKAHGKPPRSVAFEGEITERGTVDIRDLARQARASAVPVDPKVLAARTPEQRLADLESLKGHLSPTSQKYMVRLRSALESGEAAPEPRFSVTGPRRKASVAPSTQQTRGEVEQQLESLERKYSIKDFGRRWDRPAGKEELDWIRAMEAQISRLQKRLRGM